MSRNDPDHLARIAFVANAYPRMRAAILAWMAVGLFDLLVLRRRLPGPRRGLENESPVATP